MERLSEGPVATSELAAPFKMAMPSFLQHLDVLADCGLVRSTKAGRVRTYEDHRMVMAAAVLGLAVPGIVVEDAGTVAKTMPEFTDLWQRMLDERVPAEG